MNLEDRLEFENIKIASLGKRAWAFVIDDLIISLLIMLVYAPGLIQLETYDEIVIALSGAIWQIVAIKVAYHSFFTWYFGASLGKMAMKISVIDARGFARLSFGASLLRAVVRVLSEGCFYLGFIWAFASPLRQTWQDKAANSVVIDVS